MNDHCQLMNQSSVLNPFGATMRPAHRYWAPQPINMPPMNISNFPNQQQQQHNYGGRGNWKGNNWRKDSSFPQIKELEHRNRLKAKRFYDKKNSKKMRPFYANAPRNTTSYLIRAKMEGGITSLVSPFPTPDVLKTPVFSPSREALGDMAREEWGVDGYGSMKRLIRLRTDDYEDDSNLSEGESDVEEHLEVERRLDQDLSRFEMVYPTIGLENRVDDQDSHLSHLKGENVVLKERLFVMEKELVEMKMRMQFLERRGNKVVGEVQEELLVGNVSSENDESDGLMDEEVQQDYQRKDVGVEAGEEVSMGDTLHNYNDEFIVQQDHPNF